MPSDLRGCLCGLPGRNDVAFVCPADIVSKVSSRALQGAMRVGKCTPIFFEISRDPDIVMGQEEDGRIIGVLTELHDHSEYNGKLVIALKGLWINKTYVTCKMTIHVFVRKSLQWRLIR